jgi:DNA polymerase-1
MFKTLYKKVRSDPDDTHVYHELLIPGSEFLINMEMKGLILDPQRVHENEIYVLEQLEEPTRRIQYWAVKYTGAQINIGSPAQLGELLYRKMRLGPIGSSTDEDAIIRIQRVHNHPIANPLLRWKKLRKQLTTYVRPALPHLDSKGKPKLGWIGLDDAVHPDNKLHGTPTGRLGSTKPNMQNQPRDPRIRGQFISRPGKILIEIDLNQAELRCLAIMSRDPTLIEIYTSNTISIHDVTATAFFGPGYDDDQKIRAKAVNFGIVYGRSASDLAEEFDIPVAEAEQYIKAWMARYPVAAAFIEESRMAPNRMHTIKTNFGRKKRWGVVHYDTLNGLQNQAANYPHQSTAHDITLKSGIIVQPNLKQWWDIDIVNEIHDALYLECVDDPEVYLPATHYVQTVMQAVPVKYKLTRVPFIAEAKKGTRWGRDYMDKFEPLKIDPSLVYRWWPKV